MFQCPGGHVSPPRYTPERALQASVPVLSSNLQYRQHQDTLLTEKCYSLLLTSSKLTMYRVNIYSNLFKVLQQQPLLAALLLAGSPTRTEPVCCVAADAGPPSSLSLAITSFATDWNT